jgi:hypothetical protein
MPEVSRWPVSSSRASDFRYESDTIDDADNPVSAEVFVGAGGIS